MIYLKHLLKVFKIKRGVMVNNLKKNRKLLLTVSVFISGVFLYLSSTASAATIWDKRNKAVETAREEKVSEAAAETSSIPSIDPEEITVPEKYGSVIETHRGIKDTLIVHIQDAHCNYEGQMNSANILQSLIENYDLNLVLVEGKVTERDFKYLRHKAPPGERKKIADKLMKEGYFTGVNYLDLASDYPILIRGIEDKGLYDEHGDAMWEIDTFKDLADLYIGKLITVANAMKPYVYNEDLISLDNKKKDYEDEKIDLVSYYEYLYDKAEEKEIPLYTFPNFVNLVKVNKLEKEIDFIAVRDGSASDEEIRRYTEYTQAVKDLNVNDLFKEEPMIEGFLEEVLSADADQGNLVRISKALSIMKNLLRIKVVPEEYKYFVENKRDFAPLFWSDFLKEKSEGLGLTVDIPAGFHIINDNLPKIEKFYGLAMERDKIFLKRTQEHIDKENVKLVALVAGGFHTPALTRLLADAGYSYVVISPKVTTKTDEELYRWALKRDWIEGIK
jgi:hypothetical protein